MREEDQVKNFINILIFLVKLFNGLKDKFLSEKLYEKISVFTAGFILFLKTEKSREIVQHDDMSHNVVVQDLLNQCDNLLDFLDYLEHSKLTAVTPLFYSRRNLLNFKLELVKFKNKQTELPVRPKESNHKTSVFKKTSISKNNDLREDSNKEKILSFIKRSPNSRTKEIVEEFSILSERTVKRNLKELIEGGLVKKLSKNKAVYYSI